MKLPNESKAYRGARDKLLRAELGLRKKVEEVATLRRKLPAGGKPPEDYLFEAEGSKTSLSQLFVKGNTLVAYSFMYGPNMARPCPMCTAMLDGLDGNARHVGQRTNLVVIAKSPIARILEFARARGWKSLKLLSSHGNSYNRDYAAEDEKGAQMPILNVFVKRSETVRHFYATEMLYAPSSKGQNARHVDMIWPLWNVLDFTPEGRGKDWYPRLEY